MAPQASVIVPLYIYPFPGAWDPLYEAATNHPDTKFTVVVNPHSGPGTTALPDGNYTREIPKLTSYDNIRTLGYVATGYAQKSVNQTLTEIDTYATWANLNSSMKLDGIFFDETPAVYSDEVAGYLDTVSTAVSQNDNYTEGIVVHNPGTVADKRYMEIADITVVFEQTYSQWCNLTSLRALDGLYQYDRDSLAVMMHSVPSDVVGSLSQLISQVTSYSNHIFLTTLDTDYYHSFSPYFSGVVDALGSAGSGCHLWLPTGR